MHLTWCHVVMSLTTCQHHDEDAALELAMAPSIDFLFLFFVTKWFRACWMHVSLPYWSDVGIWMGLRVSIPNLVPIIPKQQDSWGSIIAHKMPGFLSVCLSACWLVYSYMYYRTTWGVRFHVNKQELFLSWNFPFGTCHHAIGSYLSRMTWAAQFPRNGPSWNLSVRCWHQKQFFWGDSGL